MPRTVVSIRVSDELLKRIDQHMKKLKRIIPAVNWTRSSAALDLIVQGLEKERTK